MRETANICVTLDPLDYVRGRLDGRRLPPGSLEEIEAAIERLPYVEEVEFGHLNYITADLDTGDFTLASRRCDELARGARDAIDRWLASLPAALQHQDTDNGK